MPCAPARATRPTSSPRSARPAAWSGSTSRCFLRADGRNDPDTPLGLLADHVDHWSSTSASTAALGSDFDGCTVPAAIRDAAGLPALVETLRARGYDQPSLRKFAHGNRLRVLERTWGG